MNETLEIVDLEHLLDDHTVCQIRHTVTTCTHDVTHVLIGQGHPPVLMCDSATAYKRARRDGGATCACGRPAVDCWKINPV